MRQIVSAPLRLNAVAALLGQCQAISTKVAASATDPDAISEIGSSDAHGDLVSGCTIRI